MLLTSYTNFNKLYSTTPLNYFLPKTLNELIQDIRRSTAPLRIVGSIHTFNDISMTDDNVGTIIDMRNITNILNIDQNNKTVTVQSGCKLSKLLSTLETYKLTLPVMTAINDNSIVGAFSTGSHGSNILNGSMSSLVLAVNLITHDGNYVSITNGPELKAVKCALGCLGVIYSVTLQCVDLFSLKQSRISDDWKNIAPNLDALLKKYPYSDVNIDQFSNNLSATIILREKVPFDPKLGAGYKVLTSHIKSLYIEIELAFPYNIINDAIKAISDFHKNYRQMNNIYSDSPLLVRFSLGDDTLISMASGRKTVYISSFFGTNYDQKLVNTFMSKLSDEMTKKFGARPHYGKQHNLDKQQMRYIYGQNYNEFVRIKNKYDPNNLFSNDYIKRIF